MKKSILSSSWLKEKAIHRGFGEIGIIESRKFNELEGILEKRNEENKLTGFEEKDILKRIDPSITMENCKSIIVGVFPYYSDMKNEGNLAMYARGKDYHYVLLDIMKSLQEDIQSEIGDVEIMSFTDSGPLVDRHLAFKAGLGFWGLNGHIINDQFGSYILIGYMLTDIQFDNYDEELKESYCMRCNKCINVCPGKAIEGQGDIDPRKCRSYLTQKKEDLTEEEKEIMKKSPILFGCDMCQEICPHNQGIKETKIEEFVDNLVHTVDKNHIEELSNKKFKREYGDRAFAWRGRKQIEKNIKIIEGE